MQAITLVARFEHDRGTGLFVDRGPTHIGLAAQALHGLRRNAVVDQIHHAPHSAAAVHDGRGATQHLDALDRQGV